MIRGVLPILDVGPDRPKERAPELARQLIAGGARALQLRAKTLSARDLLELARAIRAATREYGVLLYINDRPDIAVLAEADGVHLGQEDLPAREVRAWLPAAMEIGVSCHSVQDLDRAVREGAAAYYGFGPVFTTTTKTNPDPVVGLEGLQAAARAHPSAHLVAIGGITVDRLASVRSSGAQSAAMISALYSAGDVTARMREATRAFGEV
jgi:thiamine-phosphate pyrophosphorylase